MVFTNAQNTAFFKQADQMSVSAATRDQLAIEGLVIIDDLSELDSVSLKAVVENLRGPGGRIPNPDENAPVGSTIPQPPYVIGAKSVNRLIAAAKIVLYYKAVGREITPSNNKWNTAIQTFILQYKALEEQKKDGETPDVPKITKTLAVTKWSESFKDFLSRVIGMRVIPLSYVIRETETVPAAAPQLATVAITLGGGVHPYSVEHGSVEDELIARGSHIHPLFRNDNAQVYHFLEEATRGTIYAASIKPSQSRKDGLKAWRAIVNQYTGKDKWEKDLKECDDFIHTAKWTGAQGYTLERFVSLHRTSFVSMCQCAEHVDFQLPNALTRVKYLLEGIENADPTLQAALALVRCDEGADGKVNDFEATAAFILPSDPTSSQKRGKKRGANVSSFDANASSSSMKFAKGPDTGVELRFHESAEYHNLTSEQQDELRAWRLTSKSKKPKKDKKGKFEKFRSKGKGKGTDTKKKFQAAVSAAVGEALQTREKKEKSSNEMADGIKNYLLLLANATPGTKKANQANATAGSANAFAIPADFSSELQKIMSRANGKE